MTTVVFTPACLLCSNPDIVLYAWIKFGEDVTQMKNEDTYKSLKNIKRW